MHPREAMVTLLRESGDLDASLAQLPALASRLSSSRGSQPPKRMPESPPATAYGSSAMITRTE